MSAAKRSEILTENKGLSGMTTEQRAYAQEKSRQSREATHDVDGLVAEIRQHLTTKQTEQVRFRLEQMPVGCRRSYVKAMKGRSTTFAIRAFCQMCVSWTSMIEEISQCTDSACPLYPYRPYVTKNDEADDEEETGYSVDATPAL